MGMVDGPQSSLFLTDAIREALHFYFALMRSRTQTPAALKAGCVFDVTHAQVTWLGWHAFFGVFSRKQACNSALVQALRHELDNPEFQPIQRALHSIVDMRWHRFTENIPN
ncbi:uncharacterized protein BJ171DRAFT_308841 [Polychytrium aggregatum]|uniref:uncharacterized protein n=1 Tax=Polychytrium aggregatum TaxID=110093 RepID=UPI0022FE6778|nr:uncharacterized protein BJ171DRAFT_308841 [Polychytrium aggregatum]KAI9206919.1 hypothetical protein BJ171DRAFT_308841 [Polychytrium aggregatum]